MVQAPDAFRNDRREEFISVCLSWERLGCGPSELRFQTPRSTGLQPDLRVVSESDVSYQEPLRRSRKFMVKGHSATVVFWGDLFTDAGSNGTRAANSGRVAAKDGNGVIAGPLTLFI
jgi:hypothetical protein